MRTFAVLVSVVAAVVFSAKGASAAEQGLLVYFTRGEQFAAVKRPARGETEIRTALRALFAGPTQAERRRGLRTNIPARATLRSVVVENGVATVHVSRRFAAGTRASLHARLGQLVYTATAAEGVERVRVAIDGAVLERLGGLIVGAGVGRSVFTPTPFGGLPAPPPPEQYSPLVRQIQQRLLQLRYLPPGSVDGLLGQQTRHAILAFQGWERMRRDGRASKKLLARLQQSARPRARGGSGRRIEVSLARQVALVVRGSRVVRAIHVSTGASGFETPRGSFRVFRKELRSWSYPYRVWLPYASYFTGGVAFHESADVPPYPASHGCVRVPSSDAEFVYRFATLGTPVVVS